MHAFLKNPLLKNVIADTHFAARDRMGRTLVFMARILHDGRAQDVRDIAVDERTSVLLEPDGKAVVVGGGSRLFLQSTQRPEVCKAGTPPDISRNCCAQTPGAGQRTLTWGDGVRARGPAYALAVESGWCGLRCLMAARTRSDGKKAPGAGGRKFRKAGAQR